MTLTTIGFDADDTLWQTERFFRETEQRFYDLMSDYGEREVIAARLLEIQRRNLEFYGYGIKGFMLSMMDTVLALTERKASGSLIEQVMGFGREMATHPVEILPHVFDVLEALTGRYRLVLITKGDLFDQDRKVDQSGLRDYFEAVEIVSDKTTRTYQHIFARHGDGPDRSMMIGNSLRSDVIPAIEAGSWGVFVPHPLTWVVEYAEAPHQASRFRELPHLGALAPLLDEISDAVPTR